MTIVLGTLACVFALLQYDMIHKNEIKASWGYASLSCTMMAIAAASEAKWLPLLQQIILIAVIDRAVRDIRRTESAKGVRRVLQVGKVEEFKFDHIPPRMYWMFPDMSPVMWSSYTLRTGRYELVSLNTWVLFWRLQLRFWREYDA